MNNRPRLRLIVAILSTALGIVLAPRVADVFPTPAPLTTWSSAAAMAQPASPVPSSVAGQLLAEVDARQRIRIIVGMRLDFQPEGFAVQHQRRGSAALDDCTGAGKPVESTGIL